MYYASKAIISILLYQGENRLQAPESDVHKRQILTSKISRQTERINP